ncbi:MAG TPA: hypothetical protein VHP11_11055 [Tepidisphaeraceae bacterium]|nr:hypothetical protein [Tepidisphaeraceae bacterium]
MDGVRTAIAGFLLVCLILPQIIKNRHQYYAALVLFLAGLGFLVLADMFGTPLGAFWRFCHVVDAVFDIVAFLLLVLAAGGLTVRQLTGDLARAYEVMRRGETEKTIIIPRPGQMGRDEADEEAPPRYVINDPAAAPQEPSSQAAPSTKTEDTGGSIPLI